MSEVDGSGAAQGENADEQHFRCAIAMGLKLDVWVGPEALRTKQGLRKTRVPLADVTHFGVRRRPDGSATLTELRLVTRDNKVHKVPFVPSDEAAQQVVARLAELRPDADVSGLMWTEAAPLLGIKAFGWRDYFVQPWTIGGVALLVGSPVAVQVVAALDPSIGQRLPMGAAMAIMMVGGVVAMGVGWLKLKKAQSAEAAALAGKQHAQAEAQ